MKNAKNTFENLGAKIKYIKFETKYTIHLNYNIWTTFSEKKKLISKKIFQKTKCKFRPEKEYKHGIYVYNNWTHNSLPSFVLWLFLSSNTFAW